MSYQASVQNVQVLLEETNDAFAFCGGVNTDYAEFAALSIQDFKRVLRDPMLTRTRLVSLLRQGMRENAQTYGAQSWSGLMAQYVTRSVNTNI